jgi:biopolymer transport protein ExbD
MAKKIDRRPPEDVQPGEPPMTPMIDVVFQLLIFFLLTMKFTIQEGELLTHLPRTRECRPAT